MFDFLKLLQKNEPDIEKWLLDNFAFTNPCEVRTNDCFYPLEFKNHEVYIKIFSAKILYEFSLQKLARGFSNGLNFNCKEMQSILQRLQKRYAISLTDAKVINIEIGFTYELIPALPFIQNTMAYRTAVKRRDKHLGRGQSFKFRCAGTEIKGYDKGSQLRLPYSMLRFEKKITRSKLINTLGITCLNDLSKNQVQMNVITYYIKALKELIIVDDIPLTGIRPMDVDFIKECRDSKNWEKNEKFGRHTARGNAKRKLHRLIKESGVRLTNEIMLEAAYAEYEKFIT